MSSYALLDQAEEDALHKTRLLTVEERPFKRITKRLLDPEKSLISNFPTLPPTPPPDPDAGDSEDKAADGNRQAQLDKQRQWREDALLDFAAYESSVIRIQFLLTSNNEERQRYAQKKLQIEETAQAVRDNTTDLRTQLLEAQRILALRKEYDTLAEKITGNRLLRPRDEQHASLNKLHAEIAELERESQEYAETWNRRRQQFDKIVDQTTEMQRQIKDEKEEVERREGMEDGEDAEDEPRGNVSGAATPKPDLDAGTPLPSHGKESQVETLSVHQTQSRAKSPLRESQLADDHHDKSQEMDEDEMAEDGEVSNEPEDIRVDHSGSESDNDDSKREGKAFRRDRMDVT